MKIGINFVANLAPSQLLILSSSHDEYSSSQLASSQTYSDLPFPALHYHRHTSSENCPVACALNQTKPHD
jgi:hypothetical protein